MTGRPALDAAGVIRLLGLARHPEGGWFREMFRDPAADTAGRSRSTAIYYMLEAGEASAWHRVDAVEVWHWYAGAPLSLRLAGQGAVRELLLGPDLAAGQRPQAVVAQGQWQGARSLGAWTLAGCTVAPGFRFEGFELAPPGWSPSGGG